MPWKGNKESGPGPLPEVATPTTGRAHSSQPEEKMCPVMSRQAVEW